MITRKGYTLSELMLTIAIMAIVFATIVAVGLNPLEQYSNARDKNRESDINSILNAIYLYSYDNGGQIPDAIPSIDAGHICRYGYGTSCEEIGVQSGISLDILVDSGYIVEIPRDPHAPSDGSGTYYEVTEDSMGNLVVTAQSTEGAEIITVSR